ncbi:MAG: methylmalonyl Co-A mutase-associated GTPase MeaB [Halobacteriaceae archaeon]
MSDEDLVDAVLDGEQRALARIITRIENRSPGYRDLVATLHRHAGDAGIIGVTGSPGSGKSTLVDQLVAAYRERGQSVGVIAVDPASPFTGGAVLGDRIRMESNIGDSNVFVRSMSARGTLGGLSTATSDAVTALDAFGMDRIIIETVGAGQNEVDIVKTADTVAVLVPPGSGDDVQMLKAGILEIGDVFVVNKADLSGADRMVRELTEMIQERRDLRGDRDGTPASTRGGAGHHAGDGGGERAVSAETGGTDGGWVPPIVETVAKDGEGISGLLETIEDHREYLTASGELQETRRQRYEEEIRAQVRSDLRDIVAAEFEDRGGIAADARRVLDRESDTYTVVDAVLEPIRECLDGPASEPVSDRFESE